MYNSLTKHEVSTITTVSSEDMTKRRIRRITVGDTQHTNNTRSGLLRLRV